MRYVPHAVAELHPRLTFETNASQIHSHQQRVSGKARQGLPSPTLWKVQVFLLAPHLLWGRGVPCSPRWLSPRPLAPGRLLTAALLSEKAAQDKVHHAGGLVRAPPQRVRQLLQVSLDVLLQKPFWVPYQRFDDVHQVLWGQEDKMSSKVLFVEGMASAGEVRRGEEPVPSQRTVSRRDVSVIQTVEATENRGAEMNVV